MKKKILILMFAFCLIMLAGCGTNYNIKLASTNLSVADFYNASYSESSFIYQKGLEKIEENFTAESETYLKYAELIGVSSVGEAEMYSVVSAMDFCYEINDNSSNDDYVVPTQKIYEYKSTYQNNSTVIVIVNKQKGKQVYTCDMYAIMGDVYDYEELITGPVYDSYKFSVSQNKEGANFELSDTQNDVNATFKFDKKAGILNIKMKIVEETSSGNATINIEKNLYNYKNNVLGGRTIVNVSHNSVEQTYIQEYLGKAFEKLAKVGTVANLEEYVNMEKTEEKNIAVDNEGDKYGFKILYSSLSDVSLPTTNTEAYGLFEK